MHVMFDHCKVIYDAQYSAVPKFFVMGGGGGGLWGGQAVKGGLGVSSPRKCSNLEAMNCYFQHSSCQMSPKNRSQITEKGRVFQCLFPRSC